MDVPKELKYTEEHEWILIEKDVATIGITEYAQGELGDIVFIELPNVADEITQMEPFGTIEAVKAVSDLYAPLTGTIVEANSMLEDQPELINKDPYRKGWMIKMKMADQSEVDSLLSAADYIKQIS